MTAIETGYLPGALGSVIELHERYYGEQWNLGHEFTHEVATEFTEFVERYDEGDTRLWLVLDDPDSHGYRRIVGSIVIDGEHGADEAGARLRWFVLDPAFHGQGLGRNLMDRAMAYCEDAGFERVFLWTYAGLDAARHLYEDYGFTLVAEQTRRDWGPEITYQKFEMEP